MKNIPRNPIKFRYKRDKGETKKIAYERLIAGICKFLKQKERRGKIGIRNTISKEGVIKEIEKICLKNGNLHTTDKIKTYAYPDKLEYLYHRVVNAFLQKPDNDNPWFMPGLVTNNGLGVYFTKTNKEVDIYKKKKLDRYRTGEINVEHRCTNCYKYVGTLPEHIEPDVLEPSVENNQQVIAQNVIKQGTKEEKSVCPICNKSITQIYYEEEGERYHIKCYEKENKIKLTG